jgi:hypothetical protein
MPYAENAHWAETWDNRYAAPPMPTSCNPRLIWPPQEPIVVVSNWPEDWDEDVE